jgi:transcriptional regulator with XRE-family HTH domain
LASKAGVTRQTVIRLEAGDSATVTTIRKLAKALGVKPADLMEPLS